MDGSWLKFEMGNSRTWTFDLTLIQIYIYAHIWWWFKVTFNF